MNCCKVREHLPDTLDGALAASVQGAVERHLESCAECREEHRVLLATRALLARHGATRIPVDLTHLAARLAVRSRRPVPALWLRRGVMVATAAAALTGFVWQWQRAPQAPGSIPPGVRVRDVAEVEELHQAFAVQQSLDERDGLVLFAPQWAERGP
jgi:anti-sigma factor RsiW